MNKLTTLFFMFFFPYIIYGQNSETINKKMKSKTTWKVVLSKDSIVKDSVKIRTFFYNKKGKVIHETEFSGDGSIHYSIKTDHEEPLLGKDVKTKYSYDKNGLKLTETSYTKDSSIVRYSYFKYDDKNNIIEEKWNDKGSPATHVRYFKYDDKNNLIEEKIYLDDLIKGINTFTYDNVNNRIEGKFFIYFEGKKNLKMVQHYSYEYW